MYHDATQQYLLLYSNTQQHSSSAELYKSFTESETDSIILSEIEGLRNNPRPTVTTEYPAAAGKLQQFRLHSSSTRVLLKYKVLRTSYIQDFKYNTSASFENRSGEISTRNREQRAESEEHLVRTVPGNRGRCTAPAADSSYCCIGSYFSTADSGRSRTDMPVQQNII